MCCEPSSEWSKTEESRIKNERKTGEGRRTEEERGEGREDGQVCE